MEERIVGIYVIRHLPTGQVYVGQSKNILNRWIQHRKQLRAGTHHNDHLRLLSESASDADFEFEIVRRAPDGLTALQMQRWLVAEERKACQRYVEKGKSLNVAEPQIVETREALEEFWAGWELRRKAHDQMVSAKRRELKAATTFLEEKRGRYENKRNQLSIEHESEKRLVWGYSAFRNILLGRMRLSAWNAKREKIRGLVGRQSELTQEIDQLTMKIFLLTEERRKLYREFSRTSGRSSWWEENPPVFG